MIEAMSTITIKHYLVLSAVMFAIGLFGIAVRRNLLVVLMCIEVLMNAINVLFVAMARYYGTHEGHVVAILVMSIAAVEAAIGLGIVMSLFNNRHTVDTNDLTLLKG